MSNIRAVPRLPVQHCAIQSDSSPMLSETRLERQPLCRVFRHLCEPTDTCTRQVIARQRNKHISRMSPFSTGADSATDSEWTRHSCALTSPKSVRELIAETEKGAANAAPEPSVPSFGAVLTCSVYYEEYCHRKDPYREAKAPRVGDSRIFRTGDATKHIAIHRQSECCL
jgi:hypothetical protein